MVPFFSTSNAVNKLSIMGSRTCGQGEQSPGRQLKDSLSMKYRTGDAGSRSLSFSFRRLIFIVASICLLDNIVRVDGFSVFAHKPSVAPVSKDGSKEGVTQTGEGESVAPDSSLRHGVVPLSARSTSWHSPWGTISEWFSGLYASDQLASQRLSTSTSRGSDKGQNVDRAVKWQLNDINKYNISQNLGTLFGFGDFQSRKHTDLFFVSAQGKQLYISVVVWDPSKRNFASDHVYPLPKHVDDVDGLIPIDINLDGLLDVVVIYRPGSNRWSISDAYELLVMKRDPEAPFDLKPVWDSSINGTGDGKGHVSMMGHPFVADINFDGYPDLVFHGSSNDDASRDTATSTLLEGRFVWVNDAGENLSMESLTGETLRQFFVGVPDSFGDVRFSSPHSSAFVDVNGDCVADLVFDVTNGTSTRMLEIWLGSYTSSFSSGQEHERFTKRLRKGSTSVSDGIEENDQDPSSTSNVDDENMRKRPVYTYSPQHTVILPTGAQQISFADINGDGTTDIVFPVCGNGEVLKNVCSSQSVSDSIGFALNVQPPLCTRSSAVFGLQQVHPECRSPDNLCEARELVWDIQTAPFNVDTSDQHEAPRRFAGATKFPITFHVGDFNADGYPDILSIVQYGSRSSEILLLRNSLGSTSELSFTPFRSLPAPSSSVTYESASFFDFGENGLLDVVAVGVTENGWWLSGAPYRRTVSFLQSVWEEPLFLKFSGLNGGRCNSTDGRCRGYGSACYGGMFKLSGSDLSGTRFARSAPLLPLSAYSPLQLPYTFVGLGYVNNYIDYFFYGAPLHEDSYDAKNETATRIAIETETPIPRQLVSLTGSAMQHDSANQPLHGYHRWISLIPNSFVIIHPYPRSDPSQWTLELSVSPSKMFWRILAAAVTTLVAIGAAVWYLDRKERLEDLKEHQGFRRHFLATI